MVLEKAECGTGGCCRYLVVLESLGEASYVQEALIPFVVVLAVAFVVLATSTVRFAKPGAPALGVNIALSHSEALLSRSLSSPKLTQR